MIEFEASMMTQTGTNEGHEAIVDQSTVKAEDATSSNETEMTWMGNEDPSVTPGESKHNTNTIDNRSTGKKEKYHQEIDKHRYNIRTIMQLSNATPIRTHMSGTGFGCCFCDCFFPKAADLKVHTIMNHDLEEKNKFMQNCQKYRFLVKLDITDLRCNLCAIDINSLEVLIEHLNETHEKSLHTDIKNQIVCFKFEDEKMQCIFCKSEYTHFKPLLEHMKIHYRNYICDICGEGFVNQSILGVHANVHKLGEFKCKICGSVYETRVRLHRHERRHVTSSRLKCFQCGERFTTDYRRKLHLIETHGAEFPELRCEECDKIFMCKKALKIHKQRDHLLERRFKCDQCSKDFFYLACLKTHLATHLKDHARQCTICSKAFKNMKALKQHMRTHSIPETT